MSFSVTFTREVQPTPFTGRIVVFFAPPDGPEPRQGPDWFRPSPMLAVEVRGVRPGETVTVGGAGAIAFPKPLGDLPKGPWKVQAVLDKGLARQVGDGAGNGYSAVATVTPALTIDRIVPEPVFREAESLKEIVVPSLCSAASTVGRSS